MRPGDRWLLYYMKGLEQMPKNADGKLFIRRLGRATWLEAINLNGCAPFFTSSLLCHRHFTAARAAENMKFASSFLMARAQFFLTSLFVPAAHDVDDL